MSHRILFILLFHSFQFGFAQGSTASFSGTITLETNEPVAWATVHIKEIGKHAVSDEKGQFSFTAIPYGTYTLDIQSVEISRTTYSVALTEPKVSLHIQVKSADIRELEEVVVEGNSIKEVIERSGYAVNVVETKTAALQSLQTNDLLNRSVGVRVRQNGGLGSQVSYNLNGMSGNSVRLLIDGIPISTYGNSFSLNSIPPSLIDRIEVYKGVLPAHLADDALGGAINIVLKKGVPNSGSASISYGSFNTTQSNLNVSLRDSKTGLTLKTSGFYNYSDNDYEVWGKFVRNILANGRYDYVRGKRFNDAYRSTGGQVFAGITGKKWIDEALIGINLSNDFNEIQHGTYMTIPYKGRFTTSEAVAMTLSLQKRDLLTKGLNIQFNGVSSERKQVVNDTVKWNYDWFGNKSVGLTGEPILRPQGAQQGAPTLNHINRNISTYRTGIDYSLSSNHRIVLNHFHYVIDRTEQDFMRSAIEREFIGTRNLKKQIASVSYEIASNQERIKANLFFKNYQQRLERMNPILLTTGGTQTRSENRTSSDRNTNGYGLTSIVKATDFITFMLSAEKAVRLPSENEIFGSPGDNITENIGLLPERSDNMNLGFRVYPLSKKRQLMVYASGFIRDTKDKIVQRINPRLNDAVQTNPYENLGSTKSIGFEAEVNYTHSKQLNLLVNLSKFNSVFNQQLDPNGNQYIYYNQQLPNEPFFTINTLTNYQLEDVFGSSANLTLNHSFNFVDRFYTTWLQIEDFRTPRQFVHDLGMTYRASNEKWVVSIDARNIFNKQVYDNFAVQKPGRALYFKITYLLSTI